MKLHLPKLLRNAVIACVTMVTGVTTTTVGTATLVGGIVTVSLSFQHAQAAYATNEDGTVGTFSGGGNGSIDLKSLSDDATLTTVIFDMAEVSGSSNWMSLSNNRTAVLTKKAQIGTDDKSRGFIWNAASANTDQGFTGEVVGSGLIAYRAQDYNNKLRINGDASKFTGNIELAATHDNNQTYGDFQLMLGNGSANPAGDETGGVAGTGDIIFKTTHNKLVFNYTDNSSFYVTNNILVEEGATSKVTIEKGDAVFTKDVAIHTLITSSALTDVTFAGNATLGAAGLTNSITSAVTVAEGGSLTLCGTISLATPITNNGVLTFAQDIVIDLSNLAVGEDGAYTIFSGEESSSFAGLTSANITGVSLTGKDVVFDSTGKISFTRLAGMLEFSGGELLWDTTSASFTGEEVFEDGKSVAFMGDSEVTLAENIDAEFVEIAEDATVSLTGNGYTLNSPAVSVLGTLVLNDAALNYESRLMGDGVVSIAYDMTTSADTFAEFTGNVEIAEDTTVTIGEVNSFGVDYAANPDRQVVVKNNAVLDLNGLGDFYYKVALEEGATLANNSEKAISTGLRKLPVIVLNGDATVHAVGEFGLVGAGHGDTTLNLAGHTLTKTGAGVFHLVNTDISAGTIYVQEGTLLTSTSNSTFADNSKVVVGEGAVFEAGNASDYTRLTLELEDGATFNYRTGTNSNFKALNTGEATISAATAANQNMTITGASVSTGVLTKENSGGLVYNGSVTLQQGMNIVAGSVTFNSSVLLSGVLKLDDGASLNIGNNGSVKLALSLMENDTEGEQEIPTENGLVSMAPIQVLDKAESATTNLSSVSFGEKTYLVDSSGYISGAKVFYVVEAENAVTIGGENPTDGVEKASGIYVGENGTLIYAGGYSGVLNAGHVTGNGTVEVNFSTSNHEQALKMDAFTGTIKVTGKSNLVNYSINSDAVLQLVSGEHWSNGGTLNLDLQLSETKGAYIFRNSATMTLNGKLTGQFMDICTGDSGGSTIILTNSENEIGNISVGNEGRTAHLIIAADMSFGSISAPKVDSTVKLQDGLTLTLGENAAYSNSTIRNLHLGATSGTLNIAEQTETEVTTVVGTGKLIKDGAGTLKIKNTIITDVVEVKAGVLELASSDPALASTKAALNIESGAAVNTATSLSVATLQNAGTIEVNGALMGDVTNSGALKAETINGIAVGKGSFISTGGSIELDGDITSAEINISGTELKGSISAAGAVIGEGVRITGEVTIAGAVLNGVIANEGTLTLTGITTLGMEGVLNKANAIYEGGQNARNGYALYATEYEVLSSGVLSPDSSLTWQIGEELYSQELINGKVITRDTDFTTFWIQLGTEKVTSVSAFEATTKVALNGGTLEFDDDWDKGVEVMQNGGYINLVENRTFSKSQLSGEGVATLQGDSTCAFNIGTDLELGSNIKLADTWAGKVVTEVSQITEDTSLELGNRVEFAADTLTLGAKLTQAGELILGRALTFSTFDATVTADTLWNRGEALSIGLDTSALTDATVIDVDLITLTTATPIKLMYFETEIIAGGVPVLENVGKDGLYNAYLSWDGNNLNLRTDLRDDVIVWNDAETGFGAEQEWDATATAGKDAAFLGAGTGSVVEVKVTGGEASVKDIVISNHTDGDAKEYTFTGDSIHATGNLDVSHGASLVVSNELVVDGDAAVVDGGTLKIEGEGASLSVGGAIASAESTISVAEGTGLTAGDITAAAGLDNSGTVTVTNGIVAYDLINSGTLSTGSLQVVDLKNTAEFNAGEIEASTVVNSGDIVVSGMLKAGAAAAASATAGTLANGEIQNTGNMTVGGVSATRFTMTGGTLEITTDEGFRAGSVEITGGTLVANTIDWGIDGATLGAVEIEGTEIIKLSNATLTDSLNNEGNLKLSGKIDITALTPVSGEQDMFTDLDGSRSETGNGYDSSIREYQVVTGNGAIDGNQASWINNGTEITDFEFIDGLLTEKVTLTMQTYHVNTGMEYTEETSAAMSENETKNILAQGGTLDINAAMAQKLTVNGATVNANAALENEVILNSGKLYANAQVAEKVTLNAGELYVNSSINGVMANGGTIHIGSGARDEVKVSGSNVTITGGNGYARLAVSSGVTAELDMVSTIVNVDSTGVTLNGTLSDGKLAVTEGASISGSLDMDNSSTLSVTVTKTGTVLTNAEINKIKTQGIVSLDQIGNVADIELIGAGVYDKYFSDWTVKQDASGKNVVAASGINRSYYTGKAGAELSTNGAVGLAMADDALVYLNSQTNKASALGAALSMLDAAEGKSADELGANLAGASTAVLGMATAGDIDRQLQAIRNRTTTMGVNQGVANHDMPYYNAWINAEGDLAELGDNGTESGYKLNSWGGTVGFDVDLSPGFTAGLALTAMYGDLDTTGADKATGSIDTYYLTAFARYAPSAWTHTFVGTIGMSDISLDRTVGGMDISGETSGTSFGFLYEVGRVFALDEDGEACLQPVFNVTWKHTTVDSYTEEGTDAALEVDEQTVDTLSFGLGARLQSVVGESTYNRTSILDARVLAKFDVGDRSSSTDVTLGALKDITEPQSVESTEMGAFGLEAGVGLTIPVGQEGSSIFMDASVELRSDYTNVNGTVGYRVNF